MNDYELMKEYGYDIDACGNVYSYKYGNIRMLKQYTDRRGYKQVYLQASGKPRKIASVHRLVALKYLANPENKREVNHKDGNKANNIVDNLEWCTTSENCLHAHANGLRAHSKESGKPARQIICVETGVVYESINEAARQTGIGRRNIGRCVEGVYNTAGKYHWEDYNGPQE